MIGLQCCFIEFTVSTYNGINHFSMAFVLVFFFLNVVVCMCYSGRHVVAYSLWCMWMAFGFAAIWWSDEKAKEDRWKSTGFC